MTQADFPGDLDPHLGEDGNYHVNLPPYGTSFDPESGQISMEYSWYAIDAGVCQIQTHEIWHRKMFHWVQIDSTGSEIVRNMETINKNDIPTRIRKLKNFWNVIWYMI